MVDVVGHLEPTIAPPVADPRPPVMRQIATGAARALAVGLALVAVIVAAAFAVRTFNPDPTVVPVRSDPR